MSIRKSILATALAAATFTAVIPMTASADNGRRDRHERRYDNRYEHNRYENRRYDGRRADYRRNYRGDRCEKSGGTTGLLLGGVAGALLGRAVDTRGERTTGTVVGAGAGALAGRAIDRNSKC